jgi:hypothetical protein
MYDKIKTLLPSLADDGSKEMAEQFMDIIGDVAEKEELLNNKGFKRLLDQMRGDFRRRLLVLIAQDPELKALRTMFIRTTGLVGAQEQIETSIQELIERSES